MARRYQLTAVCRLAAHWQGLRPLLNLSRDASLRSRQTRTGLRWSPFACLAVLSPWRTALLSTQLSSKNWQRVISRCSTLTAALAWTTKDAAVLAVPWSRLDWAGLSEFHWVLIDRTSRPKSTPSCKPSFVQILRCQRQCAPTAWLVSQPSLSGLTERTPRGRKQSGAASYCALRRVFSVSSLHTKARPATKQLTSKQRQPHNFRWLQIYPSRGCRCAPLRVPEGPPNLLRAGVKGPHPPPTHLWPTAARRLGQLRTGASPWIGGHIHDQPMRCPGCALPFSRAAAVAHLFACGSLAHLRSALGTTGAASLWLRPEAALAFVTAALAAGRARRRPRE